MHAQRHPDLVRGGPERLEVGIVPVAPARCGMYGNQRTAHSRQRPQTLQLLDGLLRRVHRQEANAHEPVGRRRAELRHVIVVDPVDLARELRAQPHLVHHHVQADVGVQHRRGHAVRLHVPEAPRGVVAPHRHVVPREPPVRELRGGAPRHHQDPQWTRRMVRHREALPAVGEVHQPGRLVAQV